MERTPPKRMQSTKKRLTELAKRVAFRYTRYGAPRYPYNLEPIQLATLVMELERLRDTAGTIVEIGVARGMTTRFLCEHLAKSNRQERFAVIDTFTSFTKNDLAHEVMARGKNPAHLKGFEFNDYEAWTRNFAAYPWLTAYQANCADFDYARIAPIKLALLDVDLYLPTRAALEGVFQNLTPGGVILIDDCAPNSVWDGALQAYSEFCAQHGIAPSVIGNKCGVLRK